MATHKNKKILAEAVYSGFSGIDVSASHTGKAATSDMVNWQINKDGSIEKRRGFRPLCDLGGEIEAIWSGLIGGEFFTYAFADGKVLRYSFTDEEAITVGAPPASDLSSPRFFYLGGTLYLVVGGGIFSVGENSLSAASGYVPLMGKDWQNDIIGEIYQPMNLLNRKARFTYIVSDEPSVFFRVVYSVASIDAVRVNGRAISSQSYYFDSLFNSVNISGLGTGDRVEIAVTFAIPAPAERSELLSTDTAAVFGGVSNSRVFMWNKEGAPTVFSSAFVNKADADAAKAFYPSSDSLYFPEGYEFSVGDGKNRIRAVQRHFDRLLFFTDGDVWMADSDACGYEYIPVMNINSSIGCSAEGAVAIAGNDPISVGSRKIYLWTSDTDELNECNAYSISDSLGEMIPSELFGNARVFSHRDSGEVWFYDPEEDDTAWIYQVETKNWFRYTGISAEGFFDANGEVGFYKEGVLYTFDKECDTDIYLDGESDITATFKSGFLDFGVAGNKRLTELGLSGEKCRSLKVTLEPQDIDPQVFSISMLGSKHSRFERRLNSGRFRQMTFTIKSEGSSRPVIHGFRLAVK